MYPWLWFWAPQFHLPWSGGVAQRIEPNTNWFFDSIPPEAGNGKIEKEAFEIASYGKQLGLITEVLIDLAERAKPRAAKATASLDRLKSIKRDIEKLKAQYRRPTKIQFPKDNPYTPEKATLGDVAPAN